MQKFNVEILSHGADLNVMDDNVDVEITMGSGEVYSATFFTLGNLKSLMDRYKESGECANGRYVWAADMLVVERLTEETILKSVEDLVRTGEIHSACTRIR